MPIITTIVLCCVVETFLPDTNAQRPIRTKTARLLGLHDHTYDTDILDHLKKQY